MNTEKIYDVRDSVARLYAKKSSGIYENHLFTTGGVGTSSTLEQEGIASSGKRYSSEIFNKEIDLITKRY